MTASFKRREGGLGGSQGLGKLAGGVSSWIARRM
jgi:hypothetical protein